MFLEVIFASHFIFGSATGVNPQVQCGIVPEADRRAVQAEVRLALEMIRNFKDDNRSRFAANPAPQLSSLAPFRVGSQTFSAQSIMGSAHPNGLLWEVGRTHQLYLEIYQSSTVTRQNEFNYITQTYPRVFFSLFDGMLYSMGYPGNPSPLGDRIFRAAQILGRACGAENYQVRGSAGRDSVPYEAVQQSEIQAGVLPPMISAGPGEAAQTFCPENSTAQLSGDILVRALESRMQDYSCFYIEKNTAMRAAYEAARQAGQLRTVTSTFQRQVGNGPWRSLTESVPETIDQWKNRIQSEGGPTYSPDELFVATNPSIRPPARDVDYAMTSALIGTLIGIPNYRFTLSDDRNSCYADFLTSTRNMLGRHHTCQALQSHPDYMNFLRQNAACLAELKNRFCQRQPSRCIDAPDSTVDETSAQREARERRDRQQRPTPQPPRTSPPPAPQPAPAPQPQVQERAGPTEAEIAAEREAVRARWRQIPSLTGTMTEQSPTERSRRGEVPPGFESWRLHDRQYSFNSEANLSQSLRRNGYHLAGGSCFFGSNISIETQCLSRGGLQDAPPGSVMVFARNCNSMYLSAPVSESGVVVFQPGQRVLTQERIFARSGLSTAEYSYCGAYVRPMVDTNLTPRQIDTRIRQSRDRLNSIRSSVQSAIAMEMRASANEMLRRMDGGRVPEGIGRPFCRLIDMAHDRRVSRELRYEIMDRLADIPYEAASRAAGVNQGSGRVNNMNWSNQHENRWGD